MAVTSLSVQAYGVKAAASLLDQGFADYLVKIRITPDSLRAMVHTDRVDLAASQVLLVDGEPAGAGLISRRGRRCRLSCMCLLPEVRRKGAGSSFLNLLLKAAKARGDSQMELEVIAQNSPAVALYQSAGFERLQELKGFQFTPSEASEPLPVAEKISLARFIDTARRTESPDIPWQISTPTLAKLDSQRHQAYAARGCMILVNQASSAARIIRSFVPSGNRAANAIALRRVVATAPGSTWRAPALFPSDWTGGFNDAGFRLLEISQWHMRRILSD